MTHAFVLAALCTIPHAPAQVTLPPPPSEAVDARAYAPSLERGGVHGSATVNALDVKDAPVDVSLDLDARGNPSNVQIVRKLGSTLDAYVEYAALHATYAPEMRNCVPVTGQYTLHVKITKNPVGISMRVALDGPACYDHAARMVSEGAPISLKMKSKGKPSDGTVVVRVQVDVSGQFVSGVIVSSSAVKEYDQAALRAARNAKYEPAISSCQAAAGDVVISQHFGAKP